MQLIIIALLAFVAYLLATRTRREGGGAQGVPGDTDIVIHSATAPGNASAVPPPVRAPEPFVRAPVTVNPTIDRGPLSVVDPVPLSLTRTPTGIQSDLFQRDAALQPMRDPIPVQPTAAPAISPFVSEVRPLAAVAPVDAFAPVSIQWHVDPGSYSGASEPNPIDAASLTIDGSTRITRFF